MTSRGPLTLAALASAAVPGLDPDTVEGVVPSGPANTVEVAFISDQEHRRWVIRCPKTPAASAQIERAAALLALLSRRLTLPVPAVKGWVALPEGGRAAVHSYLTGRLVNLAGVAPGSTLATGMGRAIAQLHNLDPRVYEEAGVPVYDAASYRSRRLADLDRAAATGRVPTGLLTRWERVLDDETLWAFTTTPTHGAIGGDTVLATPDAGTDVDANGPDVKAILGWESAQVADPADDLAPLLAELDPEAFDTVLEAYAHARVERPDRHLQERARVVGEMQLVRAMMTAVAAGDDAGAEEQAVALRRLDDRLAREEEAAHRVQAERAPDVRVAEQVGPADQAGPPDQVDTQPVRTGSTAASTTPQPVHTGSTAASDTPQPVHTGSTAASETPQPVHTGSTAASDTPHLLKDVRSDADESDDAVQVEHPAAPTPVTQASGTQPSEDQPPEATEDEASVGEATVDEAPVTEPDVPPKKGSDHVTAEITPINDEDDADDVLPPSQRA